MKQCAWIIVVTCLVMLLTMEDSFCADFDQEIKKVSAYIEKEKWPAAITKLEALAKAHGYSKKEHGMFVYMLAKCHRENGNAEKAVQTLNSLSNGRPALFFYELGEACLATGRYDRALIAGESCSASKYDTNVIDGAWIKARAKWEMKKYQDCADECEKVIIAGNEVLAANQSLKTDKDAEIAKIITVATALSVKAKDAVELELLGADYLHYRKGREAQFAGQYEEAIRNYDQISGGILKDAGKCYSGECLAKSGREKEALDLYEEIIEKDKSSLYYGEVLYNAAKTAYMSSKHEKPTPLVLKYASASADWCDAIANSPADTYELIGITNIITKNIINPMKGVEFIKLDDCGNLMRNKAYPRSIVNHMTTPWYLPLLRTKSHLFYGFLLGESGKKGQAAEEYKKGVNASGKARILTDSATLSSLLAGLVENSYLVPEECFEKTTPQLRKMINMAFFFFVAEEPSAAEEIIKKLDGNSKTNGKAGDIAMLSFAKAVYCLSNKKRKEGIKILTSLTAVKKSSLPVQKWAKYVFACQISGEPSKKETACSIFEELARERKSLVGPMALTALASCHFNYGDLENAAKTGAKLRTSFKDTPWAEVGGTMRDGIEPLAASFEKGKPADLKTLITDTATTPHGKIIDKRFTIVLGGNNKTSYDNGDIMPSDIMLCRLTYISRNSCSIIRGLNTTLSVFEAQPPPTQGNKIAFLRVPLLFSKKGLYDFDKELGFDQKQETQ